jgi:hypothetical protein
MTDIDEGALRAVIDREEIRELGLLYCHYMWTKDMQVVDLYTEDGRFGDRAGQTALNEMYSSIFQGTAYPHPYAHNHVVEFDGAEHATGVCYNDLRYLDDGVMRIISGFWKDEYVRVNGAWKFKVRQWTPHFSIPESERWTPDNQ